jgi:hypothetical protein
MENAWMILDHEFCGTEFAVIVVPSWIRAGNTVLSTNEESTLKVHLLSH